jgi:hypothetical protein
MMKTSEWVKALRSGDYEQGQEYLCRGGKFCCLGVLCEIQELQKQNVEGNIYYVFEGLKTASGGTRSLQQSVIPQSSQPTILEDLNLRQTVEDEDGDKRTLHTHLICMNDAGKTFDEIADYIEGVMASNAIV